MKSRILAGLTNLVEAQSAERPIPLVSFVARQRDLRELVGEHVPGAEKLAALNHGTIKSPIKGQEPQLVLAKCRNWAASVGEIRIGAESNPTITVQLSGVDTASIIEQAKREDSQGNRIRRVRQMLFEQLGIVGEGEFEQFYEFAWRNTKRTAVVIFRNIRELPDSSLENSSSDWKLIIDFPFDDAGHGPRDDLDVLGRLMQSHQDGTKTLCWVPSFFSPDGRGSIVQQGTQSDLSIDAACELLLSLRQKVTSPQSLRVAISWVIENGGRR